MNWGLTARTWSSSPSMSKKLFSPIKACGKLALGILVDGRRRVVLLNAAVLYDDDPITHGEGFFLIVRNIDESDAKPALEILQFKLHLLRSL